MKQFKTNPLTQFGPCCWHCCQRPRARITRSKSRSADPYDIALAESFMATLKTEGFAQSPRTRAAAELKIFDYLEMYFHSRRLRSALGYQSSLECENQFN